MGFQICGSPIIIPCHNWRMLAQTYRGREIRHSSDVSVIYCTNAVLEAACWSVGSDPADTEQAVYHIFILDED